MARILITGGTGQVGTELARFAWPEGIELVMPNRQKLNLTDPTAIASFVASGDFVAVINPAAYTAVDKAEADHINAWQVNALAPAALAEATTRAGIPLIHISTDYVFDGAKHGHYDETDPVAPLGVYGASKEGGEQAVRTGNPRHVIMRTAWVYSAHGNNFVKTMLRVGATRDQLRVVDDQYGNPTAAKEIAEAAALITLRMIEDPGAPTGTYHFVNAGETSWCGFAREVFNQQKAMGIKVPIVEAIETKDYPTPAKRPANSVLGTNKITSEYNIQPRAWKVALSETLNEIRNRPEQMRDET